MVPLEVGAVEPMWSREKLGLDVDGGPVVDNWPKV